MCIDGSVLLGAELDPLAVLEVRHVAPGRVPDPLALRDRHTQLWRALLEFHRIAAGPRGCVEELVRDVEIAVVVDPDLGRDVGGLPVTDDAITDADGPSHASSVRVRRTSPMAVAQTDGGRLSGSG